MQFHTCHATSVLARRYKAGCFLDLLYEAEAPIISPQAANDLLRKNFYHHQETLHLYQHATTTSACAIEHSIIAAYSINTSKAICGSVTLSSNPQLPTKHYLCPTCNSSSSGPCQWTKERPWKASRRQKDWRFVFSPFCTFSCELHC